MSEHTKVKYKADHPKTAAQFHQFRIHTHSLCYPQAKTCINNLYAPQTLTRARRTMKRMCFLRLRAIIIIIIIARAFVITVFFSHTFRGGDARLYSALWTGNRMNRARLRDHTAIPMHNDSQFNLNRGQTRRGQLIPLE